jgi:hypothetical protein
MSGWDDDIKPGPIKIIAVQPAEPKSNNKKAKAK